jgi:ribosomal protein S18 acetylase RimI-like enzyme
LIEPYGQNLAILHLLSRSQMNIRSYQPEDEEAAIRLWRECGLVAPQNDPAKDIARKLKVNPEWFLVGELDGEIIASCMAGYEGHRGWINYLAVSPEHRRRGLGRQMTDEAERSLRAAGCPKINLQIRSSNTDVIAFYKAIGFKVDDVVSMGKRLEVDAGSTFSRRDRR